MSYYRKSANHLIPLAKNVFKIFTDAVGGNAFELSIDLHDKFTVDDFAYHDDMYWHGVYKYFTDVVIPHKIAVHQVGTVMLGDPAISTFLNNTQQDEFRDNLFRHDLSKFSANEAFGYAMHDFKNPTPSGKVAFEAAWHHHKMNNPHHPEYWMNPNRSGKLEYRQMPMVYVMEMVADWMGASAVYGTPMEAWLKDNLHKFDFGPNILYVRQVLNTFFGFETEERDRDNIVPLYNSHKDLYFLSKRHDRV